MTFRCVWNELKNDNQQDIYQNLIDGSLMQNLIKENMNHNLCQLMKLKIKKKVYGAALHRFDTCCYKKNQKQLVNRNGDASVGDSDNKQNDNESEKEKNELEIVQKKEKKTMNTRHRKNQANKKDKWRDNSE